MLMLLGNLPEFPDHIKSISQPVQICFEIHHFSCAYHQEDNFSVTLFRKCPYGPVKPDQLHIHHPPHSL